MTCRALGDTAAALVDGELGHAARERAQAHLGRCTDCRAEVEAQRRLKARLARLGTDPVGHDLTARLMGLADQPGQPGQAGLTAPAPRIESPVLASRPALSTGPAGPTRGRAAARPVGARRPARSARSTHSTHSARRRRTTTASALAVLSVGLLVALGGTRPDLAVVPVDPAGDGFVVDYVSRTSEVSVPAEAVTADLLP